MMSFSFHLSRLPGSFLSMIFALTLLTGWLWAHHLDFRFVPYCAVLCLLFLCLVLFCLFIYFFILNAIHFITFNAALAWILCTHRDTQSKRETKSILQQHQYWHAPYSFQISVAFLLILCILLSFFCISLSLSLPVSAYWYWL